jgi:hypothetical protein
MRKWLAKAASIGGDRVRSFAMSINALIVIDFVGHHHPPE